MFKLNASIVEICAFKGKDNTGANEDLNRIDCRPDST